MPIRQRACHEPVELSFYAVSRAFGRRSGGGQQRSAQTQQIFAQHVACA